MNPEDLICTCGEKIVKHKDGRCIDVIIHRLLYHEEPELFPAGTVYQDAIRDVALFEEDYLYERDGNKHLLPRYSSDPSQVYPALAKWNDIGGSGRIHLNTSGPSMNLSHGLIRRGSYNLRNMKRSRMEWLLGRVLVPALVEFNIGGDVDDCTWIEGVEQPDDTS